MDDKRLVEIEALCAAFNDETDPIWGQWESLLVVVPELIAALRESEEERRHENRTLYCMMMAAMDVHP